MRQFSPNCFEKISHEKHQAVTPGSCTLMSYSTAYESPNHTVLVEGPEISVRPVGTRRLVAGGSR
jgi:hypothetical protein